MALTLSAAVACGSRSTLFDEDASDYDFGTGGTGGTDLGGTAGRPPAQGGRGGVTGTAGIPDNGGTSGQGGSGAVGAGPARGGIAGFAGSDAGGAAGIPGGGAGGVYGSPAMRAACDHLCANAPTVCNDFPSDESECRSSCYPAAYQHERCELELADYAECVAARMSRNAACTLSNGECRGRGCTNTAIDDCSAYEKVFTACENFRCEDASASTIECTYGTCGPHWHQVSCSRTDPTTSTWDCACSVDGDQTFSQRVTGAGLSSCQTLATACNLSR